ncbi:MAG: uL30 family ribosomal protein [Candidatus Micrarchaeia archaeon]
MNNIAIVRIRGIRNLKPKIKKTFELLMLAKPNQCVIMKNDPKVMGMINVIQSYVAYGEVSEDLIKKLILKRGEKGGKRAKEIYSQTEAEKIAKAIYSGEPVKKYIDPVFRLHPPRKGYKNIKKAYPFGDLGKRADIEMLVKRMM